jgi:hypothetical protein
MQVNSANVTVGDVNQILLSLGGVIQKPGTDFTVSSSTLTFTTAPAANTSFFAILLGSDNGGTVTPTDGSVTGDKIASDLSIATNVTITTADNTDTLTLTSTDADANAGPNLKLFRDSSSPAADDLLGAISFAGEDAGGNDTEYALIDTVIGATTDGSENGRIRMKIQKAGTLSSGFDINADAIIINDDSKDIDFRVESDGNANMLKVDAGNNKVHIGGTDANFGTLNIERDDTVSMDFFPNTGTGSEGQTELFFSADASGLDHTHVASIICNQEGASTRAASFRFKTSNSGAPSEKFRIAANGDLTATDTTIGSNSDERLKENVKDFTYDLEKFKKFEAKTFDWKNKEEHNNKTNNRGFIAQEVEIVDEYFTDKISIDENLEDSKLIDPDEEGKHFAYTTKLGKKDAMYISVIQQLITRVETLEADVKTLKGE